MVRPVRARAARLPAVRPAPSPEEGRQEARREAEAAMTPLFSSPYHFAWFLLSMTVLVVMVLASYYGRRWFMYGFLGHAIVVIETVLVLAFGDGGQVYSVHCIWFNGLMALLYWKLIGTNSEPDKE
jgi:hypothetical protein